MSDFTSKKIGFTQDPNDNADQVGEQDQEGSAKMMEHDYDSMSDQFEQSPQKIEQGYDALGAQFQQDALTQIQEDQDLQKISQDEGKSDNQIAIEDADVDNKKIKFDPYQRNVMPSDQEFDQFLSDPGSVDINDFKDEISRIVKNPNPFALYSEINKIKDKFSSFINYITKKIVDGFSGARDGQKVNNWFIISIYADSNYQQVWYSNLKEYLIDSKFFDPKLYFKSVMILDSQKLFLARGLLKIFNGETQENLSGMLCYLKGSQTKINCDYIKDIYIELKLDEFRGKIDKKNIDEDNPEEFLYNLSQIREFDYDLLLSYFDLNLKENIGFDSMYKIFLATAKDYMKPDRKNYIAYINDSRFRDFKRDLDLVIKQYKNDRKTFNIQLAGVFKNGNLLGIEQGIFDSYIQTQIIDIYYPQVNNLFYRNKEACTSRNDWADLKGEFVLDEDFKYKKEVEGIMEFKKLILEIDKNILGTFLRPIIYKAIADELVVKKKDLYKIRYIMTLILSESYKEYKKVYRFFEELECFLNYDDNFFNFSRLKLFMSDIILIGAIVYMLYIYAPIGVFASSLILILIGAYDIIKPFQGGVKWNFGFRSFAMGLFVFSLFLWFLNLDPTKKQIAQTSSKIEKLGIYNTNEFADILGKKIDDNKGLKGYADIIRGLLK